MRQLLSGRAWVGFQKSDRGHYETRHAKRALKPLFINDALLNRMQRSISGGQALIDSGLKANEQVVVDGQYKLQPGTRVTMLHGQAAQEAIAQSAQQAPIP